MTIDNIKKAIREIEISYDYNHSKNDYDIVLNLTELANLIKTLQGKAIDEFVEEIKDDFVISHDVRGAEMKAKQRMNKAFDKILEEVE